MGLEQVKFLGQHTGEEELHRLRLWGIFTGSLLNVHLSTDHWACVRRLVEGGERTTQRIEETILVAYKRLGLAPVLKVGTLTTHKELGIQNSEGFASVLGKINPR